MSAASLGTWLLGQQKFQMQYSAIADAAVAREFPGLLADTSALDRADWDYLIFSASILARAEISDAQEAALRIAQSGFLMGGAIGDACALVLDGMSNRKSVDLAISRGMVPEAIEKRLGISARLAWLRRQKQHEIELSTGEFIQANRFQVSFWNAADNAAWMSISAPTSAGKSFIVVQWIGEWLSKTEVGDVVYIVPTRALIQQVERDLAEMRRSRAMKFVVSSVPTGTHCAVDERNVLVFTQERYQVFLNTFGGGFRVGALIVDEAHKVGDGRRGVLLQDVIERTIEARSDVRVVFASPMTDNPDALLSDAPIGLTTHSLRTEEVTVNQNLLWAMQTKGKPKDWFLQVASEQARMLGTFALPDRPIQASKRLPFVAYALGRGSSGNLLFANIPSEAETCAELLYQLLDTEEQVLPSQEIQDLQELVRTTIHDDYALARVVGRGVAFHYGNMPLLVRTEVERLFGTGAIKFLVCTSTLMEGVNLPCRNLFIRGPRRGRSGPPLSAQDFWNLAGRAGRWGKEFQGNIVCVDATVDQVWREGPPLKRSRYKIEKTTDKVLGRADELLSFLAAGTPRGIAKEDQDLEYMASYLFSNYLRHGSIEKLPWAVRQEPALIQALNSQLARIASSTGLLPEVFLRNPGISPIALEALHAHLFNGPDNPEDWLCVGPEEFGAVDRYQAIFAVIECHLANAFGPPARCLSLAILVTQWMRGFALKRLIKNRIDYESRRSTPNVPGIIRGVMSDVEEVARFLAPKYLAAYNDVVRQCITEKGRSDLLKDFLDVHVLLEFGVPAGTPLSLMALGMSRTTAILLSERIAASDWSEKRCLEWLKDNDWREMGLPALVQREIDLTLDLHAETALS